MGHRTDLKVSAGFDLYLSFPQPLIMSPGIPTYKHKCLSCQRWHFLSHAITAYLTPISGSITVRSFQSTLMDSVSYSCPQGSPTWPTLIRHFLAYRSLLSSWQWYSEPVKFILHLGLVVPGSGPVERLLVIYRDPFTFHKWAGEQDINVWVIYFTRKRVVLCNKPITVVAPPPSPPLPPARKTPP